MRQKRKARTRINFEGSFEHRLKAFGLKECRNWLVFWLMGCVEEKLEEGEKTEVGSFICKQPEGSANLGTQSKLKTNCSLAERLQW